PCTRARQLATLGIIASSPGSPQCGSPMMIALKVAKSAAVIALISAAVLMTGVKPRAVTSVASVLPAPPTMEVLKIRTFPAGARRVSSSSNFGVNRILRGGSFLMAGAFLRQRFFRSFNIALPLVEEGWGAALIVLQGAGDCNNYPEKKVGRHARNRIVLI